MADEAKAPTVIPPTVKEVVEKLVMAIPEGSELDVIIQALQVVTCEFISDRHKGKLKDQLDTADVLHLHLKYVLKEAFVAREAAERMMRGKDGRTPMDARGS